MNTHKLNSIVIHVDPPPLIIHQCAFKIKLYQTVMPRNKKPLSM